MRCGWRRHRPPPRSDPAGSRELQRRRRRRALSAKTIAYLEANQGSAKYLVAVTGSQTSAAIIIATGKPVVTIGGFNGQDPATTVSQLAAMVERGELSYVQLSDTSSDLGTWVKAHGKVVSASLYRVTA